MVSRKAGNDISRELSFEKRKTIRKLSNRNSKLYDEYKSGGCEYTMTFLEFKNKRKKRK
jgi:hypothetical protein